MIWARLQLSLRPHRVFLASTSPKISPCNSDCANTIYPGLSGKKNPKFTQNGRATSSPQYVDGVASSMAIVMVIFLPTPPVLAVAEVATSAHGALRYSFIRDEIYSPSGNHIGIMMIPVTSALGQRNAWSSLDRICGLIDKYERKCGWGCSAEWWNDQPHYRTSGIAVEARVRWSKLRNLIRLRLCGCAANAAAGPNEWLWAGGAQHSHSPGNGGSRRYSNIRSGRAGLRALESV